MHDATGVTKGIVQAGANISVTGGVISVPTANGVVAGVLSAGDYNTFNGKVSSQWSRPHRTNVKFELV